MGRLSGIFESRSESFKRSVDSFSAFSTNHVQAVERQCSETQRDILRSQRCIYHTHTTVLLKEDRMHRESPIYCIGVSVSRRGKELKGFCAYHESKISISIRSEIRTA